MGDSKANCGTISLNNENSSEQQVGPLLSKKTLIFKRTKQKKKFAIVYTVRTNEWQHCRMCVMKIFFRFCSGDSENDKQ